MGQEAAYLYDPINDHVMAELSRRSSEYSYDKLIHIYVGTFNLNGRTNGYDDDLSGWLCPPFAEGAELQPELVVVGFQEIVELSPQQIMSTDPARRRIWENAVLKCLNNRAREIGGDEYIILRGGQLVGAALIIFVKSSAIEEVKNVEGSLKKVGTNTHLIRVRITNCDADGNVGCGWKQGCSGHPHGLRKHGSLFRYCASCGWVLEL